MHLAHLAHALATDMANPIDGMSPDFNFGTAFNTWWKLLFQAAWGVVIIGCMVFCLLALLQMHSSKSNPMQHQQGKDSLIKSAQALGIAIGFGVIMNAVFFVVG